MFSFRDWYDMLEGSNKEYPQTIKEYIKRMYMSSEWSFSTHLISGSMSSFVLGVQLLILGILERSHDMTLTGLIVNMYRGMITLAWTIGLSSAFLPAYLSYIFFANEPSVSSLISASPSITTAFALRYDMSSAFPSTIFITMDTFGLFFTFLVLFVPLVAVTRIFVPS